VIALLMGCLAEMTVAHPTSGSFGTYAEYYVSPLAGFLVRYAYWTGIVLAVGTEVTAVGQYLHFWFPALPGWVSIIGFSALMILVNARSVALFGVVEYWLSAVDPLDRGLWSTLPPMLLWRAPAIGIGRIPQL
jgi:L-asparagine transporter-like permease